MLIETGSKWLFIGDSITDAGRARPVGEGLFDALGKGFVCQIDALLQAIHPARRVRVVNMGNSGDQARNLQARWQTDVIEQRPDWLSVMIGINDVWRQFDLPLMAEQHPSPEEYEETLDKLAASTRPMLKGLVMATPYIIEPNRDDPMRRRMDEYGAIVKRLAARHGALLVDTQAAFDRFLAHRHAMSIAWDRIHPNHAGHMIIAKAFLDAVGFTW